MSSITSFSTQRHGFLGERLRCCFIVPKLTHPKIFRHIQPALRRWREVMVRKTVVEVEVAKGGKLCVSGGRILNLRPSKTKTVSKGPTAHEPRNHSFLSRIFPISLLVTHIPPKSPSEQSRKPDVKCGATHIRMRLTHAHYLGLGFFAAVRCTGGTGCW